MLAGRCRRCIVGIVMAAIVVAVMAGLRLAPGLGFQGQSAHAPAAHFLSKENAGSADANDLYVIGRCTTQLDPDQRGRNDNISIAAEKLNGTVVGPGQEFSFNEVVGERSSELGYGPARVIRDGRSEPGIAGGICQLSSTLYNAALLAGMEITERRPHSRPVPYLPAGLDATVSFGAADLRWVNVWATPVTVRARIGADSVSVWIEGQSAVPDVRLYTEVIEVIAPRPAAPPDPTGRAKSPPLPGADAVASAGAPGYRVRVWAETEAPEGGRQRLLVSEDLYEPVNAVAN
ncbi:MAG TPA: VanW family protein [Bacillota bacterium]|nr:VanW family protein [Bacillota bacterium]